MHPHLTVRSLTVLFLLGSLTAAQTEHKPVLAGQSPGQAKEASAKENIVKEPTVQLDFGVVGLTKENEAKVKEGLAALSTTRYVCEGCKFDKAMSGKCAKCGAALAMKKKPVLQSSTTRPDQEKLSLTVASGGTLSYAELERTLGASSVHIDAAKFPIPGKAELVLRGGTADSAPAIQKALEDAKLFEHVTARYDLAKAEVEVDVQAGATPPTREKLATVIDGSGTKLHLSDVLFGVKG